MIRWIVDQVDFQSRPVGEFHHAFEKLSPHARIFGAVVQVDNQSPDSAKLASHAAPPDPQAIAPKVARFVVAKEQHQCTGRENQNTEGNQFLLGRRIVVPALGDIAFTVGSRFFPPMRTRLD